MDKNTYVPMNELVKDRTTNWTFTKLNMSYLEIAKHQIILWCVANLEGKWTMLGGNKFAFEDSGDATMFKIQFGFGI
jgi:hypothetical protein